MSLPISGLELSAGPVDYDHDIHVAVGWADTSDAGDRITLVSPMTKRLCSKWQVGSGRYMGGSKTGIMLPNTTSKIYLIGNPNPADILILPEGDDIVQNLPSGFTQYRSLGIIVTNMASNIHEVANVESGEIPADRTKPVVTLRPGPDAWPRQDSQQWPDPGATATDNRDGNITHRIVVTGGVNLKIKATYYVWYRATDDAGNIGEAKRTVLVF